MWPGDTAYCVQHLAQRAEGASINLTTITLSPHTGKHADDYYHYELDSAHPATMALSAYMGRARVATVFKTDGPLVPDDCGHVDLRGAERVLVHSAVSDLPDEEWPTQFPYLSVELVEWLASLKIVLIGSDSPSVDAFDSKELRCHHAINQYKMVNIELLQLRGVPDGDYELIALPLKLDLACGSPVRAILRTF